MMITFYARHPGSNYDSFIWKSGQTDIILNSLRIGKRKFWFLSTLLKFISKYLSIYLSILFFRRFGISVSDQSEKNYKKSHIMAKNSVGRCIRVVKNILRWISRHLNKFLRERGLHYEPEKQGLFMYAVLITVNFKSHTEVTSNISF